MSVISNETSSSLWDGAVFDYDKKVDNFTGSKTNVDNLTGSNSNVISSPEYAASVVIWKYFPPVLLFIGTFGNVATIIVYRRLKWRGSTQPLFLTTLAIVDLTMLYSGLVPDIANQVFDLGMRGLHDVSCKVLTWVMESSALMSSWLLVAMTMQRAMSVTWPHRVTFLCSRRKAYITIVFIVLTASGSHVHFLLGLKVHEADAYLDGACQMSEEYAEFWGSVWSWVFHVIIYSLVPTVLLLISNFALIRNMRASARQVSIVGTSSSADKLKKVASSVTVTLVTISVTFLLLVTPIEVVIILWHMMNEAIQEDPRLSARMDLAWAVTNMCWYANSAVNFLLYCLSGSRFREEFFNCLRCYRKSPVENRENLTPSRASFMDLSIREGSRCNTQV